MTLGSMADALACKPAAAYRTQVWSMRREEVVVDGKGTHEQISRACESLYASPTTTLRSHVQYASSRLLSAVIPVPADRDQALTMHCPISG